MTDKKLAHLIKEKVDEIVSLAKENDLKYLAIGIRTDDGNQFVFFNNNYWESKHNIRYSNVLGFDYGENKKENEL